LIAKEYGGGNALKVVNKFSLPLNTGKEGNVLGEGMNLAGIEINDSASMNDVIRWKKGQEVTRD